MEITVWGDYACPFCYLGETQLEEVINKIGMEKEVKIRFMAYQLNPDAPVMPEQTMLQHFMSEHNHTEEESQHLMERITAMAARVGLNYNLADVQVCNTMDAHRLMKYAQDSASQQTVLKLNFKLFHANFIENLRLSDHNVLLSIAEQCGLDRNSVESVLDSTMYEEQVKKEEESLNNNKEFDLIPFMVFNDSKVLQGIISIGAMKKALTDNEPNPENNVNS